MNINEHNRLTDEIIGEAALLLLQERGPINTQTLIAKLRTMEDDELDGERKNAISQVIIQLTSGQFGISDRNAQNDGNEPMRDNVVSLFGNEQSVGGTKKH